MRLICPFSKEPAPKVPQGSKGMDFVVIYAHPPPRAYQNDAKDEKSLFFQPSPMLIFHFILPQNWKGTTYRDLKSKQAGLEAFAILVPIMSRTEKKNSPPNNWRAGNKEVQLIMKRIFMCNWFFICQCIGDYVLDFVLENVSEVSGLDHWLHLLSFPFRSLHFISFHFLITGFETLWRWKELKWTGNE